MGHPVYVMVTFVNISNISVVTDVILAKLFGPKFLGALILLRQNFFWPKYFFGPNFFSTFFSSQIFLTQNLFYPKSFVLKISLNPEFLWTPYLFNQTFFGPSFFYPKFFSSTKKTTTKQYNFLGGFDTIESNLVLCLFHS